MSILNPASSKMLVLASSTVGRPRPDMDLVLLSVGLALLIAAPVIQDKLQLGTVVCVGLFPFLLRDAARDLHVRLLITTLILWVVGQLVADEVNGLGLRLSAPIILAVTILATTTTLVHFARGDFRSIRFLTVGVTSGLVLSLLVFERAPIGDPVYWKYGFNVPVSVALLALTDLAWRRGNRIPSFLALTAICGIGIWSDSRGLAGIAALTAVFLLLFRGRRHRHPRTFFALGATALLLGALSILFVDSAQAGLLGARSAKQVRQFGSDPISILVNVRPELYQELGLFLQRPLTGFGSRPQLSTSSYMDSLRFVESVGVTDIENVSNYWMHLDIPGVSAHSMAADSWARTGVLAVPFWILVIVFALWAGTRALQFRSSPLLIMWTMLVLWDTFFSPLGGSGASLLATYLTLAVVTITQRQRNLEKALAIYGPANAKAAVDSPMLGVVSRNGWSG